MVLVASLFTADPGSYEPKPRFVAVTVHELVTSAVTENVVVTVAAKTIPPK